MSTTTYHRLTLEDREVISRCLAAGETFTTIAERLDRSVSTITREVWKHCTYTRCYRAVRSHDQTVIFRHRSTQRKKLDRYPLLQAYVFSRLRLGWSPEQIAIRIQAEYPDSMIMRVSHESIYTYLYCLPRGELRQELIRCLRQERKLRNQRQASHSRRGAIQDAISITERPSGTAERTIPGHWEGDLLMGSKASNSAVATLVERTTRYLLLVPLPAHDAYTVRKELAKAVHHLPRHLKYSLTYDRGSEMTQHRLFARETQVQVYFADPHSPWQRGTNENTNGLLRQYFPKGCDFRRWTRVQIQAVQDQLNDRPRKVLGFHSPNETMCRLLP